MNLVSTYHTEKNKYYTRSLQLPLIYPSPLPSSPPEPSKMYGTIKSIVFLTFQYWCTFFESTSINFIMQPIYVPNNGSLSSTFVSFLLKYWRTIVNPFSCFIVVQFYEIITFYGCATSWRLTQLNLCFISMLQSKPKSKIKTIYSLECVGVPLLACNMIYVPRTLELWNYVSIVFHCTTFSTFLKFWHESPLFKWGADLVRR